ncbi:MAG: DNA primase DnaG [Candidatus Woesearchaeota archaeon]
MGKISPVSSKYIIHASIAITGIVDKPDVIGAIFGQTEGLLGTDLELRELQRSGRIGRIEVNVETKSGKTNGTIIIPSSLDKAETSIVGAALEIIQRIGPCIAKIRVENIEDVRVSKRKYVIDRAKSLLKSLIDSSMPDSQELADEVAYSVRVMEITEYGKERLPAGPNVEDSDEIMVVEGRADVINLLKHGFKNAIAIGGTGVPSTLPELCKRKIVTIFVDGDRGGQLIIKELLDVAEIDFVTFAPDGKEVEELTKKEIHKALRSKISSEQAKLEMTTHAENNDANKSYNKRHSMQYQKRPNHAVSYKDRQQNQQSQTQQQSQQQQKITLQEKTKIKGMLENLIGTRGAYIIDSDLNILGKVPTTELVSTIKSLNSGIYAVVFDGSIEKDLLSVAEKTDIKFLIAMENKLKQPSKVTILTVDEL